ncbi:MAG: response regulator transcription factor, partial [Polyangiaceae bacterium]
STQLRQGKRAMPPAPKLILVVDDDNAVRTLVCKSLVEAGYEVADAADGLAASTLLDQLQRLPNLVICDVMMPAIDGFSFAKLLRSKKELSSIPIIFLTARASPQEVVKGIQAGARHYVTKPFSMKDLLAKVAKSLA